MLARLGFGIIVAIGDGTVGGSSATRVCSRACAPAAALVACSGAALHRALQIGVQRLQLAMFCCATRFGGRRWQQLLIELARTADRPCVYVRASQYRMWRKLTATPSAV